MARFHPLTVTDLRRETRDAVVLTLEPPAEARDAFQFIQGQYLTFRREFEGEEVRRSYSICAGLDDGVLRVGVKRVDGGCFSTWANEDLAVGAVLEAMPPMGAFHAPIEADKAKSYLMFAGGSGVTPVLSLIKTILTREPRSRVAFVYGNRSVNTIMFREELDDLKDRHLDRFSLIHVLEHDATEVELFTGRIDGEKCDQLFKTLVDVESADQAFICGPEPMMLAIAGALEAHGMAKDRIKFELFASPKPGPAPKRRAAAAAGDTGHARVTVDGATREIEIARQGQSVLEAARAADIDAPFACTAGVCSTCRAKLIEGQVEMAANHALEDYEVRQGYILTCQAYPITQRVVVDYDQ